MLSLDLFGSIMHVQSYFMKHDSKVGSFLSYIYMLNSYVKFFEFHVEMGYKKATLCYFPKRTTRW